MNIQEIFPEIEHRPKLKSTINISEVIRKAGVSRSTFYRVAKDQENTTIRKLRAIALALGYKMIISYEPADKNDSS